MKGGYLQRVLYLLALCGLFVNLIIRAATNNSPEEEIKAKSVFARYAVAQSALAGSSDFQYSFYHLLGEGPSSNKRAAAQVFLIETGVFRNEKRLESGRRKIASLGYPVTRRTLGKSRWALQIGRFGSFQSAEVELAKLKRLGRQIPQPLRIRSN